MTKQASQKKAQNIILYRTETCPWCHKTAEFLKKNNVTFTSIDVGQHPEAGEDMVKKSGQRGVPVIDIGGKIIVGYDEPALKKALHLS